LKKLIALPLLLIALTLPSTASEPTTLKTDTANEYGIESGKTYTSDEVSVFLDIATEEADKAIEQAYADGYKAGLLVAAPSESYWRELSASLQNDLTKEQRRIVLPWWSVPASIVLGFAGGFATTAWVGTR
jgi:hypothetical protein